ncbi:hypothetical protein [Actinocorallia aurantiaca]|uniref:hypothetical protein n=1 Tax=Actinocorallia aurantiaca TaxID=46204 RepID=UPI0031DDA26A
MINGLLRLRGLPKMVLCSSIYGVLVEDEPFRKGSRGVEQIPRSSADYDKRLRNAIIQARDLPEEAFGRLPVDAITEAIVNECAAAPIVIDYAGFWVSSEEVSPPQGQEDQERQVRLSYNVMADGSIWDLMRAGLGLSSHTVGDQPSRLTWAMHATNEQMAELDPDRLGQSIAEFKEHLQQTVDQVNVGIEAHRATVREQVAEILTARSRRIASFAAAAQALSIPVRPRDETQRIPLQPKLLTVRQLDEAMAAGQPEWHLQEGIAEQVISTITSFTTALERLVLTADKLASEDEETLRDLLLFILNANFRGQVTGETFTGRGKSDILLRWQDHNAFIGECKFWNGSTKFKETIDQLDGYTVWRDARVALIIFIRDRANITQAIETARTVLAEHPRTLQPLSPADPARRSDYLMHGSDDRQRVIRLSLLPVVIPRVF